MDEEPNTEDQLHFVKQNIKKKNQWHHIIQSVSYSTHKSPFVQLE